MAWESIDEALLTKTDVIFLSKLKLWKGFIDWSIYGEGLNEALITY